MSLRTRCAVGFVVLVAFPLALGAQNSSTATTRPTPKAAAPAAMTNADVIKLVKAGLAESLIVTSIKQAERRAFTLTADGLVDLKTSGVSDNIIRVMLDPSAAADVPVSPNAGAAPQPVIAASPTPPSAVVSSPTPLVPEIGVYYKRDGVWADLLPEVVNWKTGGVIKHLATLTVVKGDVNGLVNGANSKNVLKQPIEILVYTPDGIAITEYQLLRLRPNRDSREFRTVTGGVLHVSGGATRDLIPFESTKLATRTYTLVLPNLGPGEYGILSPGSVSSSSASAQLGKVYTFKIQ